MKSFATADFWKAYAELSPEMQEQARKAYQLWQENSLDPSLHFKKVGKNLWSVDMKEGVFEYLLIAPGNVIADDLGDRNYSRRRG